MRYRYLSLAVAVVGFGALLNWSGAFQDQARDQPPPPPEGVEVLARGPVHEAYAEPVESRPPPSPVVSKAPPDPIDELPPDQKPAGQNVVWIPGYWAWEDDQQDYVWVSGFWREAPPGRTWVPGYWQQVEEGWQWVAGFWADAGQDQLMLVPPPPPSIDQGASTPPPQADSDYVPGCWVYRETRFWWRPGFWVRHRPDWCWVPAHYCRAPGGCVFVEGYWDHPLHLRGLLFAPVRLARGLIAQAGWTFVPTYVIQADALITALFVRPAAYHYYFGDYFEDRYQRGGFVPWVDYRVARSAFDPNFAYYRHEFRREPRWEEGLRDLYRARFRGDVPRPPRTLEQQAQVVQNLTVNQKANVTINQALNVTNLQTVSVVAPLKQVQGQPVAQLVAPRGPEAKVDQHLLRLEAVPKQARVEQQKVVQQFHRVAQERRQAEARMIADGAALVRPTDKPKSIKLELPRQPGAQPPAEVRPKQERPPDARPPEQRPPVRQPPPPPPVPRHEERVIPKHETPPPPRPPQRVEPPKKETPPPPPPPPPKKESPKKEEPKKDGQPKKEKGG